MTKLSNNPPEVELGLTMEEAEFILDNCDANVALGLTMLMERSISREGAMKIVEMNEKFKAIAGKLKAQGVKRHD